MKTIDLREIMLAHRKSKKEIATILYRDMNEAGVRKVERLMRGEQTLNADELLTLAAALLVTPDDLYLREYYEPVKVNKVQHQLNFLREQTQRRNNLNAKIENESN